MFERRENFFETKGKDQWKYFADNYTKEFQERIKKDLVTIVWASGVIREDLFLEYVVLAVNVIEAESRQERHKSEERTRRRVGMS